MSEDEPTSRRVIGYAFEVGKVLVLGLWSPCTRRLCASSWPNADFKPSIIRLIHVHLR